MSSASSATTSPEQAIQYYCLLGKNLKGKTAAQLIHQAVSHPHTFVFGELMEIEGFKNLKNDAENQKAYNLLELFAYGTYNDWKANQDNYPELTTEQKSKLKQLTIVTLSAKQRILPYRTLMRELDITDVRQLEDLLIDCIYQGLIEGKLDQSQQSLEVSEAIGRDFKPENIDQMIHVLRTWSHTANNVLDALDKNSKLAVDAFESHKKHQKEQDAKMEEIEKNVRASVELQNEGLMSMMGMMGMMGGGDSGMMMKKGGSQRRR